MKPLIMSLLVLLLLSASCFADDFYIEEKLPGVHSAEQDFFSNSSPGKVDPHQMASADAIYKPDEMIAKLGFATGTGFFVSQKGFLVTNHHVVDGAKSVMIKMNDGAVHEVEVLAIDKVNDIALLKVSGITVKHLLPILKNSTTEVGQEIMALGFPLVSLQG